MKHNRSRPLAVSTLLVAITACISIYAVRPSGTYFEVTKHLEILTSVFKGVHEFYVEEPEPGTLMSVAIDAMLDELDPYTIYYPESRIEDLRFMNTGEYGGIGALVQPINGRTTVIEVYEGYPAQEAGIRPGDILLSVDGKSIDGEADEDVGEWLKGESGSQVEVRIDRPYGGGVLDLTVDRAKVRVPAVTYSGMLDDTTGYIYLSKFTRGSAGEVRKALMSLRDSAGMKQLVLDLRGNGGGLLKESVSIVNLFVPKGTEIVSTRGKSDQWNKSYLALGRPTAEDMPLVVLIDGQSASASEIVSGTLQDLDRAVIVGMESFGKGLVQQTKDMAFNTRLKVTVAKYYTASGRCIQRLDYGGERDAQGKAKAVSDTLLRTFRTTGGRPVIEGRGIQPDIEVETPYMSTLLQRLLDEYEVFHYATRVASALDSTDVPDPVSHPCSGEFVHEVARPVLDPLEQSQALARVAHHAAARRRPGRPGRSPRRTRRSPRGDAHDLRPALRSVSPGRAPPRRSQRAAAVAAAGSRGSAAAGAAAGVPHAVAPGQPAPPAAAPHVLAAADAGD